MKRSALIWRAIGVTAMGLVSGFGLAEAASHRTVVKTAKIRYMGKVGPALVNSRNLPLYLFTRDTKTQSNCTASCTTRFKPLKTGSRPLAKRGSGVKQHLLGTIHRPNGLQVTYNGHPLYTATKDHPKLAFEEGCTPNIAGGKMWVVSKTGNALKVYASCTAGY